MTCLVWTSGCRKTTIYVIIAAWCGYHVLLRNTKMYALSLRTSDYFQENSAYNCTLSHEKSAKQIHRRITILGQSYYFRKLTSYSEDLENSDLSELCGCVEWSNAHPLPETTTRIGKSRFYSSLDETLLPLSTIPELKTGVVWDVALSLRKVRRCAI